MIRVECTCGEVFNAADAHVGKHLLCRRCGRTVVIARVEPGPVPAVGPTPRSPQPATAAPTPARASHPPRRASSLFSYVLGGAAVLVAIAGLRFWLETPEAPPPSAPPAALAPPVEEQSAPAVPAPPCDARPRPQTGAMLLGRADQTGEGELTVSNGTGEDTVVVLVDAATGRRRHAMFVRQSGETTLRGVREGSYSLRFQLGERLNPRGRFCEPAGSQEFDRSLDFEVTEMGDHRSVSTFSVTLHHVVGGNARTHPVPDSTLELPGG